MKIISQISDAFVNLSPDKIDDGINYALKITGEFFNVDCCNVFYISSDGKEASNSHEWRNHGIEPQMNSWQNISLHDYPWWLAKLKIYEPIVIPCVAEMPSAAALEKDLLQAHSVQSFLAVPMGSVNKLVGFMALYFITAEKPWSAEQVSLLKVVAGIIASMMRLQIALDISKLKQKQEKLKMERTQAKDPLHTTGDKYRFLINNVNEAIIVAQDGMFKFVNPMALKLLKCTEDELVNKSFIDFIHPDDQDMVVNLYRKRIKGEAVAKRYTYRIKLADGSIKWGEVSSTAIEWEGRPAALTLINDVTERKKMEDEMCKADKLESIGILAGGIAHELNNYMAVLLGNVYLAKLYKHDLQKVLEKLENIEQATLHAKELSDQLFTYAKGAVLAKKVVSINRFMVENVKFTLSGSKISCDFDIDRNLHMVEIDEAQFRQVLNNIVINATQAMPEGGVIKVAAKNITITAASEALFLPLPEGNYVEISIKDEGIGIPEKYLQKIFDPYFTTKQDGSGLGLATSYSIIQNHAGYLRVESEMGVGTTFYIYLPASTHAGMNAPVKEDDQNIYGRGKILVMDDQEDYLKVIEETLSACGYAVSLARDGREASEIYMNALNQGQPFDLVIMDITAPALAGKNTIKELLDRDPAVKAIVSSSYLNDPIMANFRDYGFKGVIRKPFVIEELTRLICDTLG